MCSVLKVINKNNFFFLEYLIRTNDRIVNVNGHPVVRYMEYTALKLIRESTDFVNLVCLFFPYFN